MGTYENFYLNQIKQLQEENRQLRALIQEGALIDLLTSPLQTFSNRFGGSGRWESDKSRNERRAKETKRKEAREAREARRAAWEAGEPARQKESARIAAQHAETEKWAEQSRIDRANEIRREKYLSAREVAKGEHVKKREEELRNRRRLGPIEHLPHDAAERGFDFPSQEDWEAQQKGDLPEGRQATRTNFLGEITDPGAVSLAASHLGLHTRVSTEPSWAEKAARKGHLIDEIPRDIDPKTGELVPASRPQGMMPPRPGPSEIPGALTSRPGSIFRSFTEKIRGGEPETGVLEGPEPIDPDKPEKGVFKGPPPFDPNKPEEKGIHNRLNRAKYIRTK